MNLIYDWKVYKLKDLNLKAILNTIKEFKK